MYCTGSTAYTYSIYTVVIVLWSYCMCNQDQRISASFCGKHRVNPYVIIAYSLLVQYILFKRCDRAHHPHPAPHEWPPRMCWQILCGRMKDSNRTVYRYYGACTLYQYKYRYCTYSLCISCCSISLARNCSQSL